MIESCSSDKVSALASHSSKVYRWQSKVQRLQGIPKMIAQHYDKDVPKPGRLPSDPTRLDRPLLLKTRHRFRLLKILTHSTTAIMMTIVAPRACRAVCNQM